jgi:N-acetylneuraminic acid mutarotase
MNLNQDQSKIILFGGGTLNKEKLNTVYEFNIATSSWKKLSTNDD